MNCPHCNHPLTEPEVAKLRAQLHGAKSRRTLTPEQAKAMCEAKARKKKLLIDLSKAENLRIV